MENSGVEAPLIYSIVDALSELVDLRKCKPGEEFLLTESTDGGFVEFKYVKDPRTIYRIARDGEELVKEKIEPEVARQLEKVDRTVQYNLYETVIATGETPQLVMNLVEIFSWEIDFAADVREGDEFDILVEKEYIADEFIGYGRILAARYKGYFGEKWAFLYQNGKGEDYYDPEGESLRRAIMRAPLSYSRISSKFNPRRLHPILKVYRPHYGVDYAAPNGTRVMAAGDGVVQYAGWKGAYGNYVRIKHPNGYETGYGHLSRIAKGVRKGARVKGKQLIGWVGSTGLSTGPHLQYEVIRGGKYVDPLRMKLPPIRSLQAGLIPQFGSYVEHVKSTLQNWTSLSIAERQEVFRNL
jgi:murein DD-endopeptidase MepM/ murein hydrolase activator NlpD